jgi:hypothetical protein
MKYTNIFLLTIFALILLIPMVSADTQYIEMQRGATMKDYVTVSLGIENIPGITIQKATSYYNWISVAFLFLIGSMSSKRMTRFFAVLVPIFAGLFVYLGWLQANNPVQTYGIIIFATMIGIITYMKGSLKENFGGGGPGSLILNIVFYLIILQTCVGLVNMTGVWTHGNQTNSIGAGGLGYQQNSPNADLSSQVNSSTQSGGFLSVASGVIGSLTDLVIGVMLMFLQIIMSIACFSYILLTIFPIIGESPLGLFMLAALQIGIWFCYAIFLEQFARGKMGATDF